MEVYSYTSFFVLTIESAPTNRTVCSVCQTLIAFHLPRIKIRKTSTNTLYFHLYCFTPPTHVRIRPEHVTMKVDETQVQEVQDWIYNWNTQFEPRIEAYRKHIEKGANSTAGITRRVLIEAFKFLDILTVSSIATKICKKWYHISWEDEVWRAIANPTLRNPSQELCLKDAFVQQLFHSCIRCKRQIDIPDIHIICPITARPVCYTCYHDRESHPQRLVWLKEEFNLTREFIAKQRIRTFTFDATECTYFSLVNKAIAGKRKSCADAILKQLDGGLRNAFGRDIVEYLRTAPEACFGLCEWHYLQSRFQSLPECALIDFIAATPQPAALPRFLDQYK